MRTGSSGGCNLEGVSALGKLKDNVFVQLAADHTLKGHSEHGGILLLNVAQISSETRLTFDSRT